MRVKNSEGHQAGFYEGVLLTDAPEGRITLTPALAHALGRALLVYANRNGVGRETLDEAPPRVVNAEVGDPYRRAVRDLVVGQGVGISSNGPGPDAEVTELQPRR